MNSTPTANTTDPIEVRVLPERTQALRGIVSDMPVLLEIKTGGVSKTKRPAVELAIVLDKSGSMRGSKLEECKTAIVKVIENLTSQDRLHLVTYDTQVQTVFQGVIPDDLHRPSLISQVEDIKSGSSTNISGGLSRAAELLKGETSSSEDSHEKSEEHRTSPKKQGFLSSLLHGKKKDPEVAKETPKPTISATIVTPPRLQRIFLFSDGLANHGLTSDHDLFALVKRIHENNGPTVSSFGIGNDFSEPTMRGIAEHGSGHYIYMNEPQNIPKYVGKALDNLLGVIGIESTLKLRGLNGCIVKKIYDHDDLLKGAQLHDLREENLRQIVARLQVTPSAKKEDQVMSWELSYLTPSTKEPRKLSGTLSLTFSDSEDSSPANSTVVVAERCQEVALVDKKVLEFIAENRMQEAIVQKELAVQMLQDVLEVDTTGFVKVILAKAQAHLTKLKDKRVDRGQMTKEIGYDSHLNRRLSICAMTEMAIGMSSASVDDDNNVSPNISPRGGSPPRRLNLRKLS